MSVLNSVKSFRRMLSLGQTECEEYCRVNRHERFKQFGGQCRFLRLHSMAHYMLLFALKLIFAGESIKKNVLGDARRKTSHPIIFCPTHIGGKDIEMAFSMIRTPCWLVLADPRELYKSADGMMIQMNGSVLFDTYEK